MSPQMQMRAPEKPKPSPPKPRAACPISGCTSTFGHHADLVRHQSTIHGPKKPCPYSGCCYSTGRNDKMKEHAKKKHGAESWSDGNEGENGTQHGQVGSGMQHDNNMSANSQFLPDGSMLEEVPWELDMSLEFGDYGFWDTTWDFSGQNQG